MKTVLVVDRSEAHVRQLRKVLHDAGHATVARDHLDGLADYVARHRPDLVVLDDFLPELDALDAVRDLARDARTRSVPVVMIASHGHASGKVRALWQGARDYLVKPVQREEFLHVVDVLLRPSAREERLVG